MAGIFISYRDEDAAGHAGRLFDNLGLSFGRDRVTLDKMTFEPGVVWRERIQRSIVSSEVVVVVIGKTWDEPANLRRLHEPDDVLGWEIELALNAGVEVIPVLINRSEPPSNAVLPPALAGLTRSQTVTIRSERWSDDVDVLVRAVRKRFERIAEPLPQPPIAATHVAREDWPVALERSLERAPRSRSPILIAIETAQDPLGEEELPRTERHLTVTLTAAQVDTAAQAAAEVLDGRAELERIIRAGCRVWDELERAQPRLGNMIERIAGEGFAQPVAWCGRSALLARLRSPLLIAHTGGSGAAGFVSVDAGAHYFLPVTKPGEERTMQRRRPGARPGARLVDLRGLEPERRRPLLGDASSEEVALIVDPDDLANTCSSLAAIVRGSPVSPTRAVLGFGRVEPHAELVDELLAHLPCVSFPDDGLASGTFLPTLEDALREHGGTLPVPCIIAAARVACLEQAIARADLGESVRALTWNTWSWVGLPLFSPRYGEVLPAAYPHLVDLRSIASPDWYFDRREGLVPEYEADRLARADVPKKERFHLYLSGAGGTGKSCFLRYVHDQISLQASRATVWYRVDAPSSQWEDIEQRLREETTEALQSRLGDTVSEILPRPGVKLGTFLRETAKRLRERPQGIEEIVIFVDQLERTFESGDEPERWRLARISRELMQLLQEVEIGEGIRVFVASRKQYLPDFLGSSRNAQQCGLEFNVLQTISESTEQIEFVNRVLGWAKKERLVNSQLGIPREVATELAGHVDGHPLNMMLALIELLSAHRNSDRTITLADLATLRPWERLFALDLQAAAGDDLDWYVLLAMAHARTEIVRFEEVWWRVRIVDPRLTKRADELRPEGIVERLWLFGHLGRTIHARPDGDDPARFVEFFHANLRDFLLRDVMAQGGADLDLRGRRGETPRAWRALDRLSAYAHDWEQMQQLLPSDDVRALMEHRMAVVERPRALGAQQAHPFQLLFLRDQADTRPRLSVAAAECFVFSALVHDDSGRWAFETLFPDVSDRVARCRDWLGRCSADSRPPILRYVVELESRDASDLIAELVMDESAVGDEMGRALAEILAEPLFAAGHRDRVIATLLDSALAGVHGVIDELPERVPAFVVAACDGDRDALVLVLGYCVDRLGGSENRSVRRVAGELGSAALVERWLARTTGEAGRRGRRVVNRRAATRGSILGLAVGSGLAATVDDERLAAWSAELRERLGVPVPDLHRFPGDSDTFELELRIQGRRVSTGLFRPGMVCVAKRRWGAELPAEAVESYDEALGEDALWLEPHVLGERAEALRARDFHEAVSDWLEALCRRSFEVLLDLELALALVREVMAQRGRSRVTVALREIRQAVVDLVEEGVPFALRRDALFDEMLELGPTLRHPDRLTLRLREHVKADICRELVDESGQMTTILLDEPLERALGDRIGGDADGRGALKLSPGEAVELASAVRRRVLRVLAEDGPPPIVLTVPRLRQPLARLLRRFDHRLRVLSFTELEPDVAAVPGGLVSAPGIVGAKKVAT